MKKSIKPIPQPLPTEQETPDRIGLRGAALLLGALTLALFAQGLFSSRPLVVTRPGDDDVYAFFLAARDFSFQAMRHGHVPLWNPTLFSGTPNAADFQSALFYPPNWLYLVMPLAKAIDWSLALHVFLAGFWTAFWADKRGMRGSTCAACGALFMFSGAVFYKLTDGQVTAIDAMAWIPLALLSLDGLIENGHGRWCLSGTMALGLQILAGHPQTFFNTLVAMVLYAAFRLPSAARRGQIVLGLIAMSIGAVGLSGIQVIPSLQAAHESTRGSQALSYAAASLASLPPENLLTLLAPGLFGGAFDVPYWGRWYPLVWEVVPFMGVAGLFLAIVGAFRGPRPAAVVWTALALILVIFAMGSYTPLFYALYHFVPGFALFRAHARFDVEATLFASMLAGLGLESLRRNGLPRNAGIGIAILAAVCAVLAVRLGSDGTTESWRSLISSRIGSAIGPGLAHKEAVYAGASLLGTAAVLALLAVALFLQRTRPKAIFVIGLLTIGEIFWFAYSVTATFDMTTAEQTAVKSFLAAHPGDYRILDECATNGFGLPASDVWGYNPSMLGRYTSLIGGVQEGAAHVTPGDERRRLTTLMRLLRCQYVFFAKPNVTPDGQAIPQAVFPDPLPHALLVSRWTVEPSGERALSALLDPSFDPKRTVILENSPKTTAGADPSESIPAGKVDITNVTSDSLTIDATVPAPAMLLITDSFASGWEAVGLPGSAQRRYAVLRADYVLRAIPLGVGHHRILMAYRPSAYRIGGIVSLISLLIWTALAGAVILRSRTSGTDTDPATG